DVELEVVGHAVVALLWRDLLDLQVDVLELDGSVVEQGQKRRVRGHGQRKRSHPVLLRAAAESSRVGCYSVLTTTRAYCWSGTAKLTVLPLVVTWSGCSSGVGSSGELTPTLLSRALAGSSTETRAVVGTTLRAPPVTPMKFVSWTTTSLSRRFASTCTCR